MEQAIQGFITYLHNVKKKSLNTELSYKRDLSKMQDYFNGVGINDLKDVTEDALSKYVEHLNESGFAAATVSRSVASAKAFFHYCANEGLITKDPTGVLKAPKIEKKMPRKAWLALCFIPAGLFITDIIASLIVRAAG